MKYLYFMGLGEKLLFNIKYPMYGDIYLLRLYMFLYFL